MLKRSMMLAAASLLALAACGLNGTDRNRDDGTAADREANATTQNMADTMASHDTGDSASDVPDIPDSEARPVMQAHNRNARWQPSASLPKAFRAS